MSIQVEQRRVEDLIPYARNSRTHSDDQVAQIAASIREFGWTNPVLVDGAGGIIAGHGRLLAARKLGLAEAPCIVLDHLSETQKRALIIADNKLALNAGWDNEMLSLELQELAAEDFDMSLMGFSDDELASLTADKTEGLTDPDEIPETPAHPVTEFGDVWTLGKHRIVCGDSTDADVVAKCLNGVSPHLMVTDPPYGVEYDPAKSGRKPTVDSARGVVMNDDRSDWSEAWALFPGSVAYVWHAMRTSGTVFNSLQQSGFEVRSEIVWDKGRLVMSRGHYHPQHESCWYAARGTASWNGGSKQTTVWLIPHRKSETGHGTQKPVECMLRPIENNSSAGQAVYEPFSGSGTTIIAGEMSGRSVHAVELSPAYVDVAVIRWQEFTGQQAVHEDGRLFDDLRAERNAKAAA